MPDNGGKGTPGDEFSRGPGILGASMDKRFGCVVLKANDCKWKNAHVTMFFIGEVKNYREDIQYEIIEALERVCKGLTFLCEPTGRGCWAVSKKTTAFPVLNDELETYHRKLGYALKPLGIENASKFKFNPHLSTPNDADIPTIIELGPFQLWWGGKTYDIV